MANKLGVYCARTMAHEWLQMGQVLSGDFGNTQFPMLKTWIKTYPNHYNIALTDCLTLDVFLREFNPGLANAYSGVRHDSGDPFVFIDKILGMYDNYGINPKTKTVVFSNALNPDMVFKIFDYCFGKFGKIVFGIGTDFTNDMGVQALNMVMKLIIFDNRHVAKISDDAGKGMCKSADYVNMLKRVNGIK